MLPVPTPTVSRDDLTALVAARSPLVVLETDDEAGAVALVRASTERVAGPPRPVFRWSVTEGLLRTDVPGAGPQRHNAEAVAVLRSVVDTTVPGVYVLLDLHPFLDDPVVVRLLKDAAQLPLARRSTVVLVSRTLRVPPDLEHLAVRLPTRLPTAEERARIVDDVVAAWATSTGTLPPVDPHARDLLVARLAGLSHGDVARLAHGAVVTDGALTMRDVPEVERARVEALAGDGILSYEYATAAPEDVVGLDGVLRWLHVRRAALDGSAPHLPAPRGMLLLGVQGCGKSLAARAAAAVLGVPLLRLDLAGVHDKYVGESERRLREALAGAEALAPCVVWVDEIEKALATSDGDGGASRRVLGTLLSWLAERRAPVFVAATANDISALPPELVRKGRFDELFFVDLPDAATRARLFRLHARRHGADPSDAELAALAAETDGFSGAEVEQAVVAATYAAHARRAPLDAAAVLAEVRATRPLAVVLHEQVAALRAWATGRTVPAG